MVIKICKICGKEFDAKGRALCCSPECSKINERNNHKKYEQSDKGKAAYKKAKKRYQQSNKGKAARRRYEQSDKGKAARRRYEQSDKGKTTQQRYMQRKIAELNDKYDCDINLILKGFPYSWKEREVIMQVEYGKSYIEGIYLKKKNCPVCEVTGEKKDLVIHHLYSFNTHPELGSDPANMVRITREIHDEFHSIYGYGDNTPEQWYEFLQKRGDS